MEPIRRLYKGPMKDKSRMTAKERWQFERDENMRRMLRQARHAPDTYETLTEEYQG